ncbi:MAG: hypothetical protein ACFFCM_18525 [Promethearchaeota archaeon]
MLTEILFIIAIGIMGCSVYFFAKAAIKTRKSLPLIYKFMMGFLVITSFTIDYAFAYFFLYINYFTPEMFVTYRFYFEIIMGAVGFFIFFDSRFRKIKYNYSSKFLVILFAVVIGEAYLIYFSQKPFLFNDIDYFKLLFGFYNSNFILFAILGLQKLYALIGIVIFSLNICFIVLKNKIYSLKAKISLSIGVLLFIDIIFTIPVWEAFTGEIDFVYILWSSCFFFIIFARLTKINFEAISGIHEILITYNDGRLLYNTGNEQLDPFLITGALSAIICFLKETLHSKKKVRSIDHQDKKILFSYGEFIITSVITDEDTYIVYDKVEQLTHDFEKQFYGVLKHWNGELTTFSSAWFIIDNIFPVSGWMHKKSVEEFKDNILDKIKQMENS